MDYAREVVREEEMRYGLIAVVLGVVLSPRRWLMARRSETTCENVEAGLPIPVTCDCMHYRALMRRAYGGLLVSCCFCAAVSLSVVAANPRVTKCRSMTPLGLARYVLCLDTSGSMLEYADSEIGDAFKESW